METLLQGVEGIMHTNQHWHASMIPIIHVHICVYTYAHGHLKRYSYLAYGIVLVFLFWALFLTSSSLGLCFPPFQVQNGEKTQNDVLANREEN